ncbi:MAG: DUF448 domain-containing protein [Candidatus Cloacimonetes bacterium]|nr:DUF448 domain-containing protein [Candidatus Cloacimonadota bacterium]
MPNQASKAGHKPERSCVICREKKQKTSMFRLVFVSHELIFDIKQIIPGRGYYLCNDNACLGKLEKWIRKKKQWLNRKQKSKR